MEELDQSDWESQLTRSFNVAGCRGDERKLCVVLHEGGDEIKRTCQVRSPFMRLPVSLKYLGNSSNTENKDWNFNSS